MIVVSNNTEASILERAFQSPNVLTADAARYLLSVRLSRADEERVNDLSARARTGILDEHEAMELDGYLHVGTLLAIMQSKARKVIRDR